MYYCIVIYKPVIELLSDAILLRRKADAKVTNFPLQLQTFRQVFFKTAKDRRFRSRKRVQKYALFP